MTKIFLHFTIKGDGLDVIQVAKDLPPKADVFSKGEIFKYKFNREFIQKTNRFVYSIESEKDEGINSVFRRMEKDFRPYIKNVSKYTSKYNSVLDIVIYEDKEEPITVFHTTLSKKSLSFINKLNTRLSISIFDW